jgi:ketose-bisphosphate aldolase
MERKFAFNVYNYRMVEDILRWSKELDVSVIIQTSVKYLREVDPILFARFFQNVKEYFEHNKATLHLDHCKDEDIIENCFKNGWDSALYDGSHLNLNENIKRTKSVKKLALKYGKVLEGEITPIYGEEDGIETIYKEFTTVEQAKRFCKETEVNWFAPSVGTYHGIKKGEKPKVDYKLLKEIYKETGVPLVLHGGSGLIEENFIEAFNSGVFKINISTELKMSFFKAMHNGRIPIEINPASFGSLLAEEYKKVVLPKLKLLKEIE